MKLQNPHKKTKYPKKGEFGQECNRTVCNCKNANYYNHSTRMYYCSGCAYLINTQNLGFALREGFELCQKTDKPIEL